MRDVNEWSPGTGDIIVWTAHPYCIEIILETGPHGGIHYRSIDFDHLMVFSVGPWHISQKYAPDEDSTSWRVIT
jgi:hypothetical protein